MLHIIDLFQSIIEFHCFPPPHTERSWVVFVSHTIRFEATLNQQPVQHIRSVGARHTKKSYDNDIHNKTAYNGKNYIVRFAIGITWFNYN